MQVELFEGCSVSVAKPTFKKLDELKEMGFELNDSEKLSNAYVGILQNKENTVKFINIIFDKEIPLEDVMKIDMENVYAGYSDFLLRSGLRIR